MTTDNSTPIEHQNVPQAHQGLHGFLYSSEDEHGAVDAAIAESSLAIETITPVDTWCEAVGNAKVAGVYAVLNGDRQTQYIGYSRNVALALRGHVTQIGADVCAFARVQPFKFPKRDEMEALQNAWIAELGRTPPGNVDDSGLWANTIGAAAIAAMSAAERQAYDEKKLKLRKAMAEAESQETVAGEGDSASGDLSVRRQNLEAAVTEDDWSSVVQQQTQETL
ncbi:GIY-YIG nuclease family protein [Leptolyngbyaceae cyanobacterium UHCC 1019]